MTTSQQDRISHKLKSLHNFSACDVSDALLKLQKPASGEIARGGYLADIVPFAPTSPFSGSSESSPKIIAPASTLKLVSKNDKETYPEMKQFAVPDGKHWVDMTEEGTIVVIDQPEGQSCCVVGGRVRDLAELEASELPVFALGRSTVGTGAEAKVLARNCPIKVQNVDINPGDIIFCDPLEGVVVLPATLLDDVLALMPTLVQADDRVKEDVLHGSTVFDAFRKHRS